MTGKARELLAIMASKYDKTGESELCFDDYMSFPDSVIKELEVCGFIVKQSDIVGTIKLTQLGYEESNK